jgi:hypothetical protein
MLKPHQDAIIPNGFSPWPAQRDRLVTPITHIIEAAHARLPGMGPATAAGVGSNPTREILVRELVEYLSVRSHCSEIGTVTEETHFPVTKYAHRVPSVMRSRSPLEPALDRHLFVKGRRAG